MRGIDVFSEQLFTVKRLEEFIPANHPLRPVREMINGALQRLDGLFERIYEPAWKGRASEHRTGETGACDAAASVLQHPFGCVS
jgi:hypothetical protein